MIRLSSKSTAISIPPIQLGTLKTRLSKLMSRTAPGSDIIGKGNITGETFFLLTMIFNLLLELYYFSTAWKRNRTTLIQKKFRDLSSHKT